MMDQDHPMIGQKVEWVYTPKGIGPDIIVPAIVRAKIKDGFLIDTENQKGVKVRSQDLRAT